MRTVAFLSRFALICNFLFVFCLVMQRTHDFIQSDAISGTILALGWIMAPFVNLIVCVLYGVRLLGRKPLGVRPWLVMLNFLFLLAQVFTHFILVS
ncbi:MAG: hypothetical protein JO301_12650 [Chitinophagaceae bacterium]|nr:hypothetical protein [Chitinophagaceae bacterium]